ncbi:MAG TPA: PBP1A family penicillin-binding protein [Bdellovibrionota bacterium]|jgi:penicillin-binding protein 1A|nr:PBP1A family penicillin-binding protein [Bdellovibrionota bacterium]
MKSYKKYLIVASSVILAGLALAVLAVFMYSRELPSLDAIKNYEPRLVTTVYSDNYEVIAEFSTEKRFKMPIKNIPKHVQQAFVAAEDADFYNHSGISLKTIFRAFIKNLIAGRTVQGGSTITQQVTKSILLSPEKTYTRKIKEVLLAMQIEKQLSKDEILELYLNQIYLGGGAYGVEAAARSHFNKSAKDLTLPEAAILAGLPQAPSRYSPSSNPKAAKARQHYVLDRMRTEEMITEAQETEALAQTLKVYKRAFSSSNKTPYFTEHVRQYLIEQYGEESVLTGGMKVYTTVNLSAQLAAQNAVHNGLLNLDKRIGFRAVEKSFPKESEQKEFLDKQHLRILRDYYQFEMLTPEGTLELAVDSNEPTPLTVGETYQALVVDKDKKTRAIVVQVGNTRGTVSTSDYQWAQESAGEDIYVAKNIRDPFNELKKGDMIYVQPKRLEKSSTIFTLDQVPLVQGALVAYRVNDGAIHSLVGGFDFYKSQFNRVTQAKRQSGSSFKPIVYAAGLELGLTPATVIVDSPIVYQDRAEEEAFSQSAWKPNNYNNRFYGDTSYRNALAFSRNVPAVKLAQYLGVKKVIAFSRSLGITSPLNEDLSLSLGSSALTLDELVRAWGVFANKGKPLAVHFIKRVEDRNGEILEEYKPVPTEQVIRPATAFLTTSLLQSVVEYGTGAQVSALGRPIAGKTGTTSDYKDASFVGYTPQVLAGVWVGFDESRPINRNETGASAAIPIWMSYMREALKDLPRADFEAPDTVTRVAIDPQTGNLPTASTKKVVSEYFEVGTAPGQTRAKLETTAFGELSKESPNAALASGGGDTAADTQTASLNQTMVITGNSSFNSDSKIQNAGGSPSSAPEDGTADDLLRNEL